MSKTFGIRMSGCEQSLEDLIKDYLNTRVSNSFCYYEIGAAGCQTLKAVYEIVQETMGENGDWRIDGLDLPNGWSLDWKHISNFGHPITVFKNGRIEIGDGKTKAGLWLDSNPREWTKKIYPNNPQCFDIVLVDGCHGRTCVMEDFLSVENRVKRNGLVFLHDACKLSQNTDFQDHCQENINVRAAIVDLGLLDNKREGWEFVKEIPGSRHWGGEGNGLVVIRKTK